MSHLELQHIHKSYGDNAVIHGVDWHIEAGEFVVIVGPSGCGKSTLLRMIAGLEAVTSGRIHLAGRDVTELEPAQRDIAMVFQNYALYPHMSVYNNMAYGLKIRGLSRQAIDERVQRAAEILEIQAYLSRAPRQLSGGQRQRVAMGRAIVREPSVFLFDEPLSNLDAKLRVQMRLEIKKLQQRLGITSVYVTHDQVEAMTLGHRLMVLNGGHVEQLGSPIELYERPATRFVAGFIGSPAMNLLSATLSAQGDQAVLPDGSTLALGTAIPSHAGQAVTVGLRPEHLSLSAEGLPLQVDVVEHLGADTLIHGRLRDGQTELTVRAEGIRHHRVGDALHLSLSPAQVHVFDAQTERRLNLDH
jgi:sn-glycerol 3-phosphate transport system ATP-binding protein